ncbi:MAG: sugar transferase [Sedimentisphaerales bacterium]|nr:sugar transferase [Sedimentisphaerales bacterium]
MEIIPHIRNLIVLRDTSGQQAKSNNDLLRLMVCNEPFGSFILGCLSDAAGFRKAGGAIAIPQQWSVLDMKSRLDVVHYTETVPVRLKNTRLVRENSWVVVSDGRFFTVVDNQRICETLADSQTDVITVNIVTQLRASYEKVLTTSQNELVGLRLFYEDAAQPTPIPDDWPHHLFVRTSALNNLLMEGGLPLTFNKLLELCDSKSLVVHSTNIGGSVLDLATENGLLKLVQHRLGSSAMLSHYCADYSRGNNKRDDIAIANSARLFGKTLLGKDVNIGENAIIVGPTIVGNDVKIGRDAVVRASVICPGVSVKAGELIEERVLANSPAVPNRPALRTSRADAGLVWDDAQQNSSQSSFRKWPMFSYMRFLKRILDITVSVVVLTLFAPVLPIIMLAIKLTSPGPIFFKDTRQGLHGRVIECLKFRTMQVGADRMQDRLRVLNQADGPQFMIPDDPRQSAVGKFLRETYIDEIPQFVNVLLGQMSVIGPRPSPESENRLCPFWRDARLSVRPGITGLWQVCRTRQPMRDFQEWIHYDVKYVRDLSLKLDLWISWQTAKKMVAKFVSQF